MGAKLTVIARGLPPGLGEPVFDRLDADIAHALMSINAVKAVEIGDGVAVAGQRGSQARDELPPTGFSANHAGGILGGISTGQDVVAHVSLKPTSSIQVPGRTIDLAGNPVDVVTTGRHDPCVGLARNAHRRGHAGHHAAGPLPAEQSPERGCAIIHARHWRSEPSRAGSRRKTSKGWRVAVLGATGLVGDTMINVLEERDFPVSELYPLASSRSLGKSVKFKGKSYPVLDVETFDFSKADIGLFSAGADVSAKYAPIAGKAGCVVIDNTSQFRYQDDIPLVVPEVNPQDIAQYRSTASSRTPTARPSRCWWR